MKSHVMLQMLLCASLFSYSYTCAAAGGDFEELYLHEKNKQEKLNDLCGRMQEKAKQLQEEKRGEAVSTLMSNYCELTKKIQKGLEEIVANKQAYDQDAQKVNEEMLQCVASIASATGENSNAVAKEAEKKSQELLEQHRRRTEEYTNAQKKKMEKLNGYAKEMDGIVKGTRTYAEGCQEIRDFMIQMLDKTNKILNPSLADMN